MDELQYYVLIARHGVLSVMSLVFLLVTVAILIAAITKAINKKNVSWLWYAVIAGIVITFILFRIMIDEQMTMQVWFWAK